MKEALENENLLLQILMSDIINNVIVNQFIYEELQH